MVSRPPPTIDDARVLQYVVVQSKYPRTGKTRHIVQGRVLVAIYGLAIGQYHDDPGYYLFYCDTTWTTLTDTYHAQIVDAYDQAAFEFRGLTPATWHHYEGRAYILHTNKK